MPRPDGRNGEEFEGKRFAEAFAFSICDSIRAAVAGFRAGNGFDAAALKAGLGKVGPTFAPAMTFKSGLTATYPVFPGAGLDIGFRTDCSCYRYLDRTPRTFLRVVRRPPRSGASCRPRPSETNDPCSERTPRNRERPRPGAAEEASMRSKRIIAAVIATVGLTLGLTVSTAAPASAAGKGDVINALICLVELPPLINCSN
jgi:hypothetical protein